MTEDAAAGGGESDLATVLQALGDPARLRVVEVLSQSPRRAGDLAAAVGVPAPTMSKHLRVLLAAGIVADERGARDARVRVFQLRRESVVAVRAWLDQVQARWDEQLRAFKAHVEREGGDDRVRAGSRPGTGHDGLIGGRGGGRS
jgi:DNA-binding transcriptional ArsR family regulator